MGEVWKARDTRLNRDVAIKFSSQQFTDRFEREARAIAALNHSNICTLHDVGTNYLVMELIDGPTLADRISQGPIPLEEALGIARQIGDALEAAHEKNIVHRDLKPGNIKLRPDGSVKVLDFGLAKAGGEEPQSAALNSPTIMHLPTQAGVILGTAAYMAPEQARGKPVDKRADIWSFGVVLYEMVAGKRLFEGEDLTETMAAVVMREPDLSAAPPQLRRLLEACLQKDPKKRLRDIADGWRLLEAPALLPAAPAVTAAASRPIAWMTAAAVFAIVAGALGFLHFRETPVSLPLVTASILPPERSTFQLGQSGNTPSAAPAVISPDGNYLIFGAQNAEGHSELYLRPLSSHVAQPLAGTEGAMYPFWSPDSRSVAFGAAGKLKRIDISGSPPITLADAPNLRGGTWNANGIIVFAPVPLGGLKKVPAAGGTVTDVTALRPSAARDRHVWPWFLPDGKHFLYTAQTNSVDQVEIGSLDAGPDANPVAKLPGSLTSQVVYSQGRILFVRDQTLMAQPFDAGNLRTSGDAVPVAEHLSGIANTLRVPFSASDNGILTHQVSTIPARSLAWFDRDGKRTVIPGEPLPLSVPRLSSDGTRVAFAAEVAGNIDIWVQDVNRNLRTRLTFDPTNDNTPVWSPDNTSLVFSSNRKGPADLYRKPVDGAAAETVVLSEGINKTPTDWSKDGKYLLYREQNNRGDYDQMALPLAPGAKPFPLVKTPFNESLGVFSPDGKWVAYESDESGRTEVYLTPFPGPGGKRQVSTSGGAGPRWSGDGRELFFFTLDNSVISAEIHLSGAAAEIGALHSLYRMPPGANFADVTRDGKRFLVTIPENESASGDTLTVIQNWPAMLNKK
jgi:serine/threonine protein kinase